MQWRELKFAKLAAGMGFVAPKDCSMTLICRLQEQKNYNFGRKLQWEKRRAICPEWKHVLVVPSGSSRSTHVGRNPNPPLRSVTLLNVQKKILKHHYSTGASVNLPVRTPTVSTTDALPCDEARPKGALDNIDCLFLTHQKFLTTIGKQPSLVITSNEK